MPHASISRLGVAGLVLFAGIGLAQAANPALSLDDQQKNVLKQAIRAAHAQVQPGSKKAKAAKAKDFQPTVGEKLPGALTLLAIPHDAAERVPKAKPYEYVEVKEQILLIDPMSRKIAAIIPD